MGRLVLFVLMWGVVWTEEYGSGGIPQYGGAGDYADSAAGLPPVDYTGHSPDAAAPLDYKYVEDSHANQDKLSKEVEVTDRWQKPKKRRANRHDKDDLDAIEPTHFIKHRSNHRPRHRLRVKNDNSRSNESHRRRRVLPERPLDENVDDDTNQYRDELKKDIRDDIGQINKITTERIIRRKPRDRRLELSAKGSDSDEDEFVELENKPKDVEKFMPDYSHESSRRRGRPPPPSIDEDEFEDENVKFKQPKAPRRKPDKNYRDYNDYYDMKRVYNIKNRLPLLIRRTSTEMPIPPKDPSPPPKDLMALLAGVRRAGSDGQNSEILVRPTTQEETVVFTDITHKITDATAGEIVTTSTSGTPIAAIQFVTEAIPTSTFPNNFPSQYNVLQTLPHELSLAEKSRLSILKKAQRKEKDKSPLSTKPPILLKVTNKLATVVMVEPQNESPWMRAREVSNDSPEQLEKVKRLMRHKIVSEAKDIKDLTDNWNDMVCDYIDTSLLTSRCSEDRANWFLFIVCHFIVFRIFLYDVLFSVSVQLN